MNDLSCSNKKRASSGSSSVESTRRHETIVLFYKYFVDKPLSNDNNTQPKKSSGQLVQTNPKYYVPLLKSHQERLCNSLGLQGRILLSHEGINGTLSAQNDSIMEKYIQAMETFDMVQEFGYHDGVTTNNIEETNNNNQHPPRETASTTKMLDHPEGLYSGIDWKLSPVLHTIDNENENTIKTNNNNNNSIINGSCHNPIPFPDLKIAVVNEIVSTGGVVKAEELEEWGGKHLSPEEFHAVLMGQGDNNKNNNKSTKKPIVLIDVRNTFEHAIGHFVNPQSSNELDFIVPVESSSETTSCEKHIHQTKSQTTTTSSSSLSSASTEYPAMNPEMTNFASFDSNFCKVYADVLKDRKVLMYCTGGIRCEKASAMLRKRGVDDVSQLRGGIHRYLELYGRDGLFRGKNFVFDQRVAIDPGTCTIKKQEGKEKRDASSSSSNDHSNQEPTNVQDDKEKDKTLIRTTTTNTSESTTTPTTSIVGKCLECHAPYDSISGSRICTVCRDLVLICPTCTTKLREYHCSRHAAWKHCYFTFLEVFDETELNLQLVELKRLRTELPSKLKNVRKTLSRQIACVEIQLQGLKDGTVVVDRNAPRKCRTCHESNAICNGLCWGFWRSSVPHTETKTVDGEATGRWKWRETKKWLKDDGGNKKDVIAT